jgi:hypothetical protein
LPDTISLPLVFFLTFYTLVEDAHFAQSLNLSVLSSRQGIKSFIFSRKKRKTNETYLRARVNQYPMVVFFTFLSETSGRPY